MPVNRGKYRGNANEITARSSYELRCMKVFDEQDAVLWWSSEEVAVPYRDPTMNGAARRYLPDFLVCVRTRDGVERTLMVEVKPYSSTLEPRRQGVGTKRWLYETATYATNQAKWEAASRYCERRGWRFVVWTERDLWRKRTD